MKKQESIAILDKMINNIPEPIKHIKGFYCSTDIYDALGLTIYKGYQIHTHAKMPKEYACSFSLSLYF